MPHLLKSEKYSLYNYDYNTITTSIPVNTSLGKNIKIKGSKHFIKRLYK